MICCECACSDRFLLARYRTQSCNFDHISSRHRCDVVQTNVMCYIKNVTCIDALYTDIYRYYRCKVLQMWCVVSLLFGHSPLWIWPTEQPRKSSGVVFHSIWPSFGLTDYQLHYIGLTCTRLNAAAFNLDHRSGSLYVDVVSLLSNSRQNDQILK